LRITAQSVSDLRATATRSEQGFHPSFHRFRIIAMPLPTSRCVVTALAFSPVAAAIRALLLNLLTLREGDNCSKRVFEIKYYKN
jgi:hypothetical protein